jgi:hypothetical protein
MIDSADLLLWEFGRKCAIRDGDGRLVGFFVLYHGDYEIVAYDSNGGVVFGMECLRENRWWGSFVRGFRVIDGHGRILGVIDPSGNVRVDGVPIAEFRGRGIRPRYEVRAVRDHRQLAVVRLTQRLLRRRLELHIVAAIHDDLRKLLLATTYAISVDIHRDRAE